MRFGAFVPQGWRLDLVGIPPEKHWPAMTSVAQTIEASGYESAWVYDHFHTVPVATQEPTYEAWTLMGALATVTSTVRLGQMCTCNSYRPPSYLAKVAASVDVISGGRVEMGIGAGWYEQEYLAYGYQFPKPSVRIGQLDEAVQIMKKMWTEDEASFEGRHYTIDGAICMPKPVQDPHIPLWIAGGGEKLTLRTAARYADYTNFGMGVDEFVHKSSVLRSHAEAEGRDFDEIVRTSNFNVVCEPTEAEVKRRLAWIEEQVAPLLPPDRLARAMALLSEDAGTPEQWIERLAGWKEAGLAYAIIYVHEAAHDSSALELFAQEVIPALA